MTRPIKGPFGWKQSCFCKNLALISALSEVVFKFYVFRSFSILPGLLSHFIGQFSYTTPQSCQTLGVGRSNLQSWMDVAGAKDSGAASSSLSVLWTRHTQAPQPQAGWNMTVTRPTPQAMKHTFLATSPGRCPWKLVPQLRWLTQHFAHLRVM